MFWKGVLVKVWMITLGLAILLFPPTAQGSGDPSKRAPHLQVLLEEIDFGEVKPGAIVTQEFIVRNFGDGLLKILQVRPG